MPPLLPRRIVPLVLATALAACSSDAPTTLATVQPAPVQPVAVASSSASRFERYPTIGEVRHGYVIGPKGTTMAVTYEVHDGLAIWEGDIVLGKASDISPTREGARRFMGIDDTRETRAKPMGPTSFEGIYRTDPSFRWPGGVVPYEVDPALTDLQRIPDAAALIEATTGGITLVPRSGQADYVTFTASMVCNSPVGRQGGEQIINLAVGCPAGSVAHEVLHSLGMFHEQSRCDRDGYVEILSANITSGREFNFNKECSGTTDLGAYNFGSLMHYGMSDFSSNGMPTMQFRPGVTYSGVIGQRDSLDISDIVTLNWLYGSNNKPPVPMITPWPTTYKEGDLVPMDASGSTDADDTVLTYHWNFGDNTCFALVEPAECRQKQGQHKYTNDGVYKVGLFVYDNYVEEATEAFVTVTNVKPNVAFSGPVALNEGDHYFNRRFFLDPGADFWSATVNYGDGGGVQPLALNGTVFDLDHTYVDNGVFTLAVAVSDDDDVGTGSGTVTVSNVVPVVDAGIDQVIESGKPLTVAGSFSDAGVRDNPWSWNIAWGLGAPTTGTTSTQGAIGASRLMCAAGTYNVILSVTDKDGGTGTDALQVTVGYVTVGLDITPGTTPNPVSLNKNGDVPVAILSNATFDARTLDLSSIRLGDELGTDTPVSLQKGRYMSRLDDVNGDGRLDLIVSFSAPALVANGDVKAGSTSLVIRGSQGTSGGACVNFRGSDTIKVVP